MHTSLADQLFSVSSSVRYVAVYRGGNLEMRQRPGIADASAAESDRYEELIVNPTLLTLTTQRGNIDCGGIQYLLIRYGSFFQFVCPLPDGHVSVALEPGSAPLDLVPALLRIVGASQAGADGMRYRAT